MWNAAIVLNVVSLAVVSAWFTLLLQWPVSKLVLRRLKLMPESWHKSLLISWVLLPVIVGALCSVAFILNAFTDIMWPPLELFIHWHHLFAFEWFTWHGGLLMAWIAASTVIVFQHILAVHHHKRSLASALLMAESTECTEDEFNLVRIETDIPLAFTAGLLKPQVYLSRGLCQRFDAQQLHCILAHEAAHQAKRDPLQKWLFSMLSAYYPTSLRRHLREAFELATEMKADAIAGRRAGALNVASALVAFGRSDRQWHLPMVMGFGQDFVAQRVKNLIEPAKLNVQVPFIIAAMATSVLAANLLSMDSIHHYIELILQF